MLDLIDINTNFDCKLLDGLNTANIDTVLLDIVPFLLVYDQNVCLVDSNLLPKL